MKRLLSIVLAVLMLIPATIFSAVAVEPTATTMADEGAKECTASTQNIASEASISFEGGAHGMLNEVLLTDGKKGPEDQIAHSPHSPSFKWFLTFGKPYEITNVNLYINGTGKCAKCGGSHTATADSVQSVQIILYDDLGNQVHKSDVVSTVTNDVPDEEVKFSFEKLAVAKVEIICKSASYRGAYFREVEIYKEIGEHNWVLDETTSIKSSCTQKGKNYYNCSCGAKKEERTNAHTVTEWTVTQQPTTKLTGIAEGKCTVPGCNGIASKILPRVVLADSEFQLNKGHVTFKEDLKKKEFGVNDAIDDTKVPRDPSYPEYLFDGIIESATWNPENIWCGTGWTVVEELDVTDALIGRVLAETIKDAEEKDVVTGGSTIDAEALEKIKTNGNTKVKVNDYHHSTLKIDFDQVYTLTMAELYVFSNNNSFTVDFLDAEGNSVKQIAKRAFEYSGGYARVIFTGDVYGLDVKSVLITIESAKWPNGKGLAFTEFKLGAHECNFAQEDIDAGTTENCVVTFDGKCLTCQADRVGAKLTKHVFEKDSANPAQDKIVETITEVNCYRHGVVKKHCTVCNNDIEQVILSTGDHKFDYEKPIYIKAPQLDENGAEVKNDKGETVMVELKPNCGKEGLGYEKCSEPGCIATTAVHVLPPQGEHAYQWVEKKGDEADYTHDGIKLSTCTVCGGIDAEKGEQVSPKKEPKFITAQDYTIRYTGYTSPRATFKMTTSTVTKLEKEGYSIKIYGVVQKGEEIREVQVYGDGATGTMEGNGIFSLVVKNASYGDEFKFSVKIVMESADGASATTPVDQKIMAANTDGTISIYDIASYHMGSEIRSGKIEEKYGAEVKDFYQKIADAAPQKAE
ncbi:MAG: hypothetical protein J6A54_00280 [Clostridia bacterium]|nr:hypothetical protein [Clostridia bacterium]